MSPREVYVYKGFERFWHWTQALLILFLALTGFEIHGSFSFLGFEQAVRYHRVAAIVLMVLIVFAAFWHLTTDEWRQYLPTLTNLRAQAEYYLVGVFRGAPHPTRKTVLSKLNPLQKLVYLQLKLLVIPVVFTFVDDVVQWVGRHAHRHRTAADTPAPAGAGGTSPGPAATSMRRFAASRRSRMRARTCSWRPGCRRSRP